ncbi:hypothetical protein PVAND_014515 [Polypedilum vanderplanki]|uniref:Uncharacterized protein n=1 Tax=Polypedilum vanderplanki TaxID=319348 RepID=A0A9J6BAE8_POLVA|nr:hypothetical protein PVAND_014515 [Polypedilum vanderplanki]
MSSNESVSYISNDENSNMYGDENIQLPYNNSNENSSSNDYITIFKSYPNYIFNYGYKIFINDIKDIKNFMKRIVEIPSSMRIDEIQHKIEEIDVRNFPYLFVFDFKDVNSSEESRIIVF